MAKPAADAGKPKPDGGTPQQDAAAPRPHDDAGKDASRPVDASRPDATTAQPDAAAEDAGADAQVDAGPAEPVLPETLAESGFYAEGSTTELAPGVQPYTPRYALWSDSAEKERWFYLPPDTQIDSSDMDYWTFPVGTKVWKLFSLEGKKLETRMLWKTEDGWFRMAFAWNDAETEAVAVPDGASDVRGTEHDVPKRSACGECHDGLPDRLLGVSAIQLSRDGPGMTLTSLIDSGLLSDPPSADFALPDTAEWSALGYLHANCGHCHNPRAIAYDRVDMDLWLRVDQLGAVSTTESYETTVGVALTDTSADLPARVTAGDPDMSGLVLRMETRGSELAMPPLASERVDTDGTAAVRAWIEDLP